MKRLILLPAVLIISACATGASGAAGPRSVRASDLLVAEDFASGPWNDAYEVVRALRPTWRSARRVYVDGVAGDLRSVPVASIACMRHYSESEGQARYGIYKGGEVIEVITRGAGRCPTPR